MHNRRCIYPAFSHSGIQLSRFVVSQMRR
jgi:hypothetical protein